MVGRRLAGDFEAALLRLPHQLYGPGGAGVGDVESPSGSLGEGDVPRDHRLLGGPGEALQSQARCHPAFVHHTACRQLRDLAVVDDRQSEAGRVAERLAHHVGVRDGVSVVAEAYRASLSQLRHLGQRRAPAAGGYGTDGQDAHRTLLAGEPQHEVDHGPRVHNRVGVRHGADGREAASGSGPSTGGDRFLVLEARLAQVAVEVNEAWADDEARSVDDAGAVRRSYLSLNDCDYAVQDEQVAALVHALGRVDDAASLYEDRSWVVHRLRASPESPLRAGRLADIRACPTR